MLREDCEDFRKGCERLRINLLRLVYDSKPIQLDCSKPSDEVTQRLRHVGDLIRSIQISKPTQLDRSETSEEVANGPRKVAQRFRKVANRPN